MIKKAIPFLILVAISLLASCGAPAVQSEYAAQMEPAIENLTKFQEHYLKFESLLTDPINASKGGLSRLDMIELYNLATGYKITRDDYVSMGFMPLDILVGESNKLAREGKDILELLSAATPDESAQAAHNAVQKCVRTRIDFAESLAKSIRDLVPVDLSGDISVCSTFDTDLEKLTSYVSSNK